MMSPLTPYRASCAASSIPTCSCSPPRGAAVLGQWAEGAFLLFLFSLGHAGEHYALDRARNAVSVLGELMPSTAACAAATP